MLRIRDIDQHITNTKKQLFHHATSGHELLSQQIAGRVDLPVARLLFIVASLGEIRCEDIVTVAVGLELLYLGTEKHYRKTEDVSTRDRSILLVTADYYYAKAIGLAATLRRGDIVVHLVRAIADIAESEALRRILRTDENDLDQRIAEKAAGLFRAAVRIGLSLGNCDAECVQAVLDDAAILFSKESNNGSSDSGVATADCNIDLLRHKFKDGLKILPVPQRKALQNFVIC